MARINDSDRLEDLTVRVWLIKCGDPGWLAVNLVELNVRHLVSTNVGWIRCQGALHVGSNSNARDRVQVTGIVASVEEDDTSAGIIGTGAGSHRNQPDWLILLT